MRQPGAGGSSASTRPPPEESPLGRPAGIAGLAAFRYHAPDIQKEQQNDF